MHPRWECVGAGEECFFMAISRENLDRNRKSGWKSGIHETKTWTIYDLESNKSEKAVRRHCDLKLIHGRCLALHCEFFICEMVIGVKRPHRALNLPDCHRSPWQLIHVWPCLCLDFPRSRPKAQVTYIGRNRKYPWRYGKAVKWKIGALSYRDARARCKTTSLNFPREHKELESSMVFRLWLLYLSCGHLDTAVLHSCSWKAFSETGFGSQLLLWESWRDVWRDTSNVYHRTPPPFAFWNA